MAGLPGNVNHGTVTGTLLSAEQIPSSDADIDGVPLTGTVTFTASIKKARDPGADVLIVPKPVTVTLDSTGSFTTRLVATDDPDLEPTGWTYKVSFQLAGAVVEPFDMPVLAGATINLADVIPVDPSIGTTPDQIVVLSARITALENTLGGAAGFDGSYGSLTGKPTLGTAAATASTDYATAAQGAKADTAVQPSQLPEMAQDAIAALLVGTSGVTLSYDDAANTLTITGPGATGLDAEAVRDAIGVALIGTGLINVLVNDAADTITITTTATQNSSDAALRDRSTHTGTQVSTTISDFVEAVQDVIGAMVAAAGGTYNDAGNSITLPGGTVPRVPYIFTDARSPLTSGAGTAKVPNATGRTLTIVAVRVDVATAPTGGPLTVDVNKNGTTIFTTQSNRPSVAAGATSGSAAAVDVPAWAPGETLTVDVDLVGVTTPGGSPLTVTVIAEG